MRARWRMGKRGARRDRRHVAAGERMPADLAARVRAEFDEPHRRGARRRADQPRSLQLRAATCASPRCAPSAQELIRIWRAGEISDEVLHHLEEELDYEEQRF